MTVADTHCILYAKGKLMVNRKLHMWTEWAQSVFENPLSESTQELKSTSDF